METRKTKQRLRTLELLAELKVTHGFEIAREAGLQVGTIYGILMNFEKQGFVESRWDESEPDGKPRKRLYRLTEGGVQLLQEYQEHFAPDVTPHFFGTVGRELHASIDQVWGGIFQISVRRERDRQRAPGSE